MDTEFYALLKNKTWILVPRRPGMSVIDNRWVYRVKLNKDGTVQRLKACLVTKGFQQQLGVDFYETFSPVVKSSTIRVILHLSASNQWDIQEVDIDNAFLNCTLSKTVYMEQPASYVNTSHPHYVCKLQKALYGLRQAPRAWFDRLQQVLSSIGFCSSVSDPSLFFYKQGDAELYLLVYVDDILLIGNNNLTVRGIIAKLQQFFLLKTLGCVNYFLSFKITRGAYGIHLSLSKYTIDLLNKTHMLHSKPSPTPISQSDKLSLNDSKVFDHPSFFRSVMGGLQYLTLSHPDIAFTVNKLSQFMHSPTQHHWNVCKRLLRYLKGTIGQGILFKPSKEWNVECFSDADWAGSIDDRKSTTGYCVYIGGNLITWCSKKQKAVAKSSTEAEYRALSQTATEIAWLYSLFTELGIKHKLLTVIWCDNAGANQLSSNPMFHSSTKHIEVDVHYVRDLIKQGIVEVRHIPTSEQTAHIFTKPLSISQFSYLKDKLAIVDQASQA
uniref:Reverse transcriptase Ty1/copia-type domain-containing protein n=1 Tax=Cannabis sativa TaxID=3483 RepID=A0A803Q706_CANSA